MIFKFDKSGNIENMRMEGDFDMGKKVRGNAPQPQLEVVKEEIKVSEEEDLVMTEALETQSQVAVGFESLNEDEDMIQREMDLIKEKESENDKIWDKGVKDEVVDKSDSENMMPMFGSLSEKMKIEDGVDDKEQTSSNGERIKTDEELKDELKRKREVNKLKKNARDRLKQLNSADEWKFENTIEICRNKETCKFQTIANAEFLGNLLDRKIATYVGDLQRGWKSNSKNELVEVRSEKQIKLILDSLLHDRMHGGFITLNLNPNDGHEINFNEEDHTISGSIDQKLQILDGNHRLNAFSRWAKAYKRNPESVPNPADYYISVVIETLNDDDAKSLFSEYCLKGLKISKSRGEFLNVEDYTNKLCKEIIKFSDMKDKVEVISTSIKGNSNSIISFGVLSKNIKENYSPQTKSEIEEMSKHLITFVDSLIQTFPKFMASRDLEERKLLRVNSLTMEALAWGGYFYISKLLQEKSKEEILSILSKFNDDIEYKGFKGKFLAKENPIFRKIMREGNKMISTSKSATWINKVFSEYVIDGKSLEEIGRE